MSLNTPNSSFKTPSIFNTPMSSVTDSSTVIVNSAINNLNLPYYQKQKVSKSIYTKILIFIVGIAPLVSGYGAICYGIRSFIDADINTIVVNNNIRLVWNIFIIICGMITILQGIIINIILSIISSIYYS
jgi:hypothetical protein